MKLTDTFLRTIKTTGKVQKKADGRGLYIHVAPTGGEYWRMAYSFNGKQKVLSFGEYPTVSLKDARQKREKAKEQLAKGIDPGAVKKAQKQAQTEETETFEVVAREWHTKYSSSWTSRYAVTIMSRMERDLFPLLGKRPIGEIKAPELLAALRRIESRGTLETAHRIRTIAGQAFRYAVATGRAERDPSADLRGALPPPKRVNFASIKEGKRRRAPAN